MKSAVKIGVGCLVGCVIGCGGDENAELPEPPKVSEEARPYYHRGDRLAFQGDYDKAIEEFTRGIQT